MSPKKRKAPPAPPSKLPADLSRMGALSHLSRAWRTEPASEDPVQEAHRTHAKEWAQEQLEKAHERAAPLRGGRKSGADREFVERVVAHIIDLRARFPDLTVKMLYIKADLSIITRPNGKVLSSERFRNIVTKEAPRRKDR